MAGTVTGQGGSLSDNTETIAHASSTNLTSGRLLVVMCSRYSPSTGENFTSGSCTKTAGTATLGTITLRNERVYNHFGGESIAYGIWTAPITGSGSCTITVDGGVVAYYLMLSLAEASSDEGDVSYDQTIDAEGASGGPDTGNLTPPHGDAFFFGALCTSVASATTHTADGAFTTLFEEEDGSLHVTGSHIYRVVTASTTDSASWSAPTTAPWVAGLVTLTEPAPTGGGGGGVKDPYRFMLSGVH